MNKGCMSKRPTYCTEYVSAANCSCLSTPSVSHCLQVPSPLPLSWGRTVKPYVPEAIRLQPPTTAVESDTENVDSSNGQHVGTAYMEEEDVLNTDFKALKQPFQAVLINPGVHRMLAVW